MPVATPVSLTFPPVTYDEEWVYDAQGEPVRLEGEPLLIPGVHIGNPANGEAAAMKIFYLRNQILLRDGLIKNVRSKIEALQ